jgi:hypothetical protein
MRRSEIRHAHSFVCAANKNVLRAEQVLCGCERCETRGECTDYGIHAGEEADGVGVVCCGVGCEDVAEGVEAAGVEGEGVECGGVADGFDGCNVGGVYGIGNDRRGEEGRGDLDWRRDL